MSSTPSVRPSPADSERVELSHVVVAGGTPLEWLGFDEEDWGRRLEVLAAGVARAGTRWLSLYPFGGRALSSGELRKLGESFLASTKVKNMGVEDHPRWVVETDDGLVICVEPEPDGQSRFARVVNTLRAGRDEELIDEATIAGAVLSPSQREPDLVVVLGPPTRLPTSLVWELAYSEIVFLDLDWTDVSAADLELAVDDFTRRNRRFGGLDS